MSEEPTKEEFEAASVTGESKSLVSSLKESSEINAELSRLATLKKEKERSIEQARRVSLGDVASPEFYQNKLEEIEDQLCKLETEFSKCQEKHANKLQITLESLANQHASQINAIENEREEYMKLLWEEYVDIEVMLNESFESLTDEDDAMSAQKHKTLAFVREKLKRVGSDENDLFLEYLAKRTKFEKDEDRVFEQESKISAQLLDGLKEKEIIAQKLSVQLDRFHVERERERRLIKSRLKRLQRLKSTDDLQNEESIEYLKEETSKLKEAYEKVEETEHK